MSSFPEPNAMSPVERRATFSIAGIFTTRMLGLFMIFPVFALFAEDEFANVTGMQIGIAMGIYGLPKLFCKFLTACYRIDMAESR